MRICLCPGSWPSPLLVTNSYVGTINVVVVPMALNHVPRSGVVSPPCSCRVVYVDWEGSSGWCNTFPWLSLQQSLSVSLHSHSFSSATSVCLFELPLCSNWCLDWSSSVFCKLLGSGYLISHWYSCWISTLPFPEKPWALCSGGTGSFLPWHIPVCLGWVVPRYILLHLDTGGHYLMGNLTRWSDLIIYDLYVILTRLYYVRTNCPY